MLVVPLLLLLGGGVGWCLWVYLQIQHFSSEDMARPADAIVIFGAAEYDGRPSPVYRARLDHACPGAESHAAKRQLRGVA